MTASAVARSSWKCPGCGTVVAGNSPTCPTCAYTLAPQRWDRLTIDRVPGAPPPTLRRSHWKTLFGAAAIAYSPLLALVVASVLILGASAPNEIVRLVSTAAGAIAAGMALFLYLLSWGIAAIYVDRRVHPTSYSFWHAAGSAILVYVAVALPIILVAVVIALGAGGLSIMGNNWP